MKIDDIIEEDVRLKDRPTKKITKTPPKEPSVVDRILAADKGPWSKGRTAEEISIELNKRLQELEK